jgi:hypothetical protein
MPLYPSYVPCLFQPTNRTSSPLLLSLPYKPNSSANNTGSLPDVIGIDGEVYDASAANACLHFHASKPEPNVAIPNVASCCFSCLLSSSLPCPLTRHLFTLSHLGSFGIVRAPTFVWCGAGASRLWRRIPTRDWRSTSTRVRRTPAVLANAQGRIRL